jgi:hypothetical protein
LLQEIFVVTRKKHGQKKKRGCAYSARTPLKNIYFPVDNLNLCSAERAEVIFPCVPGQRLSLVFLGACRWMMQSKKISKNMVVNV